MFQKCFMSLKNTGKKKPKKLKQKRAVGFLL